MLSDLWSSASAAVGSLFQSRKRRRCEMTDVEQSPPAPMSHDHNSLSSTMLVSPDKQRVKRIKVSMKREPSVDIQVRQLPELTISDSLSFNSKFTELNRRVYYGWIQSLRMCKTKDFTVGLMYVRNHCILPGHLDQFELRGTINIYKSVKSEHLPMQRRYRQGLSDWPFQLVPLIQIESRLISTENLAEIHLSSDDSALIVTYHRKLIIIDSRSSSSANDNIEEGNQQWQLESVVIDLLSLLKYGPYKNTLSQRKWKVIDGFPCVCARITWTDHPSLLQKTTLVSRSSSQSESSDQSSDSFSFNLTDDEDDTKTETVGSQEWMIPLCNLINVVQCDLRRGMIVAWVGPSLSVAYFDSWLDGEPMAGTQISCDRITRSMTVIRLSQNADYGCEWIFRPFIPLVKCDSNHQSSDGKLSMVIAVNVMALRDETLTVSSDGQISRYAAIDHFKAKSELVTCLLLEAMQFQIDLERYLLCSVLRNDSSKVKHTVNLFGGLIKADFFHNRGLKWTKRTEIDLCEAIEKLGRKPKWSLSPDSSSLAVWSSSGKEGYLGVLPLWQSSTVMSHCSQKMIHGHSSMHPHSPIVHPCCVPAKVKRELRIGEDLYCFADLRRQFERALMERREVSVSDRVGDDAHHTFVPSLVAWMPVNDESTEMDNSDENECSSFDLFVGSVRVTDLRYSDGLFHMTDYCVLSNRLWSKSYLSRIQRALQEGLGVGPGIARMVCDFIDGYGWRNPTNFGCIKCRMSIPSNSLRMVCVNQHRRLLVLSSAHTRRFYQMALPPRVQK